MTRQSANYKKLRNPERIGDSQRLHLAVQVGI